MSPAKPDNVRRLTKDRQVEAEGLSTCCTRELRVSSQPSFIGTRRHCGVCDRQAVVNDDGVWQRGR